MPRILTRPRSAAALAMLLLALPAAGSARAAQPITPQELAHIWDAEHISPPLPPLLDHDEVQRRLQAIASADPSQVAFEQVGESLEGRSINMLTIGHGPFRVLLWSQMHGDEATATAALFGVFEYFHQHRDDPAVRRILSSLTLYVVPMLNPDGAERFQRRNAQGIDINRDALRLQSPEGRLLKSLRDRFNPRVGITINRRVRTTQGRRELQVQATIDDLGDLRTFGGLRIIDATGLVASPLFDASLREGQEITVPDWSARPSQRTIATGQSGEIVLLRPLGDPARPASRYRVELILRY